MSVRVRVCLTPYQRVFEAVFVRVQTISVRVRFVHVFMRTRTEKCIFYDVCSHSARCHKEIIRALNPWRCDFFYYFFKYMLVWIDVLCSLCSIEICNVKLRTKELQLLNYIYLFISI